MAAFINNLFGGSTPSPSPVPAGDADFADFAGAPDPVPAGFSAEPTPATFPGVGAAPTGSAVPWTAWYNIHERHSISEFKSEGVILGFIIVFIVIHILGTNANKKKAKSWMSAHAPTLQKEFALIGFGGRHTVVEGEPKALELPEALLLEKSPSEFSTYASGRQNIAFMDVNITLLKRFSPLSMIAEFGMSLFLDSAATPVESMEAIIYPFDGRETLTVPGQAPGAHELRKDTKSTYDGFVWAVVNKETMKQLRDDRYDVSLTGTKDSPKLPNWATVMSESAEITDFMLTPELIKAIEEAGELLNHIIVTDQPNDQPLKIEETAPRKRIFLSMRLPSSGDYSKVLPIFQYFIRITDSLVQGAHFRPEVLRKVKTTREEMIKKLQKADEDEKAEERNIEREKAKKIKRDLELKALDAKGQKKYLEKERDRELKKSQKKQTTRG